MKSLILRALRTLPLCLLMIAAAGSAQQELGVPAGKWAGFWRFIPSKSSFTGPPPQIDEFTIDPDSTIHIHEMSAAGKVRDWYYTPVPGKPAEVKGRGPNVTVVVRKVSGYKIEHEWSFNGGTAKSYTVLSTDGEYQTFHIEGTDKNGSKYVQTTVYKRTPPDQK